MSSQTERFPLLFALLSDEKTEPTPLDPSQYAAFAAEVRTLNHELTGGPPGPFNLVYESVKIVFKSRCKPNWLPESRPKKPLTRGMWMSNNFWSADFLTAWRGDYTARLQTGVCT